MIYRDLTPYVKVKSIRNVFLAKVGFCEHGKQCKQCCWLWKGIKTRNGYGRFYVCVLSSNPFKTLHVRSHRFMWTLQRGHTNKLVLHTCDNPTCVSYHHLYVGTNKDNSQDMIRKGRDHRVKGEKHGSSKLTLDVISHMRALRESGLTYDRIGSVVGISGTQARRVLTGKSWKHLQLEGGYSD